MIIELDYVTVIYTCGCAGARPVQRPRKTDLIYSNKLCKHHAQEAERRAATPQDNQGVYYMVDGFKMTVTKDHSGYWRGRRWEAGKWVRKYFGVVDPRPRLEEVQV